jgi:hypothetical protein
MSGTLDVTSTPGEGSTFAVELRAAEPAPVANVARGEDELLVPRTYGGERRVVYVEDTVANVRLVETILQSRPDVRVLPAMLGQMVWTSPATTSRISFSWTCTSRISAEKTCSHSCAPRRQPPTFPSWS